MQPQTFLGLDLARGKLAKEFGNAFKMRSKFCLYLNVRAAYKLLLECVEGRSYALGDSGRKIVRAAIQFGGLRFKDFLQATMEFIQSIVASCFELRGIFFRAACNGFDFRQRRASSRDFLIQRGFDLDECLSRLG